MSDNPLLDTQIFEKDEVIKKLTQRIEQLEMEKKIWDDKIFTQSVSEDIKLTQSVIQQIQINEQYQEENYDDYRNEDDSNLQIEMKKKEDSFCDKCKELFYSINRSIHNSLELKKQSIQAKDNRIKQLNSQIIQQSQANKQAVEKIKSQEIEIYKHKTNLQACKKYISSMEKK